MATGTIILPLLAAVPDPTNPPGVAFTTTANRPRLVFDSNTDEKVVWTFRLPANFASGLTARIIWSGTTSVTTSDTVRWAVEVMKLTPDTDSVDSDVASFDTANVVNDDILGTQARRPQLASVTLTNADGAVAGDYVAIRLSRDADDAADDLAEDAYLWAFSLEYTTT